MIAPPRRWSFSLRSLFVVVTLLGVAIGYVELQRRISQERDAVLRMIEQDRDFAWLGDGWEYANPIRAWLGDFACASMIGLPANAFSHAQESRILAAFPEAKIVSYDPGSWTGPEIPDTTADESLNPVIFVFQGPLPEFEGNRPLGFDPNHSRVLK